MKFIKITCPSCGDTFDPPENQPFAFVVRAARKS